MQRERTRATAGQKDGASDGTRTCCGESLSSRVQCIMHLVEGSYPVVKFIYHRSHLALCTRYQMSWSPHTTSLN